MNGILCVDKPQGMTSFACCALLKRLTGEKKVGHAGTLDPMATGVLPIFFGKATRGIPLLPTHDKQYAATLQFGKISDTLDVWGKITETRKPYPTRAAIERALPAFRGEILQTPPMVSALKKDGVRLYELARQGIEIERKARPVTIQRLEIVEYTAENGELRLICDCSPGTYIRTLCDDLGRVLGCGAVMSELRRTAAAGYLLANCVTPEQCRRAAENGMPEQLILPVETAFAVYPAVTVTAAQATRFQNGGELSRDRVNRLPEMANILRVCAPDGTFLGLGRVDAEAIRVLRLFV